ncbi:type I-E CRISPR-associated protein Cas6/Cse3/CasE [Dokdonella fugitiva]|jgi:CRISPR system Cascade subunit CasE|uniref:type I-E CRISPR-associated protein Cas6/Cse3/CasE n=1 Tax=Dokdonella fugitiva TaxID=328517 RepID=UPI0015FC884F|nr:type I-E CRISPR-associated protein Cas6/Cse3/CasE [Dokdonella fugitiva]MBA8884108.1 CRISPR system Cascade subunit CasE [Dokdonella fugitiva]
MSWFSRVTIRARNEAELRQLRALCGRPYAQHQALWTLFDRLQGEEQPFLFRQMAGDANDELCFLMVSDDPPETGRDWWRVETKPYQPELREGQRLRFNVCLNPTRTERLARGRGKRQDYVMSRLHQLQVQEARRAVERQRIIHEELPLWLAGRAASRGFELESCLVDRFDVLRFPKGEHTVTLSVAEFSGELRVVDPERLSDVLRRGMGHGQSFGLGLLLLKPR